MVCQRHSGCKGTAFLSKTDCKHSKNKKGIGKMRGPRQAETRLKQACHHKALTLQQSPYDKPRMHEKGGNNAIMAAHYHEALLERGTMILHTHTAVEIIGDDGIDISQWQMPGSSLFHNADAPVYIGRITVIEIVGYQLGNVGAGVKRLMAHQHAPTKGTPREPLRRSKAAMAHKATIHIDNIRIAIEHGRKRFALTYTSAHHLQCVGRGERVAGIEKNEVVARRPVYSLVHGIIKPMIGF